jgi:hypothetical protein
VLEKAEREEINAGEGPPMSTPTDAAFDRWRNLTARALTPKEEAPDAK